MKKKNPDYNNLLKQIKQKVRKLEEIAVSLNFDLSDVINSGSIKPLAISGTENELIEIYQILNQIESVFIKVNNKFVELKKKY